MSGYISPPTLTSPQVHAILVACESNTAVEAIAANTQVRLKTKMRKLDLPKCVAGVRVFEKTQTTNEAVFIADGPVEENDAGTVYFTGTIVSGGWWTNILEGHFQVIRRVHGWKLERFPLNPATVTVSLPAAQ